MAEEDRTEEDRIIDNMIIDGIDKLYEDLDFIPARQSLYNSEKMIPEYDDEVFQQIRYVFIRLKVSLQFLFQTILILLFSIFPVVGVARMILQRILATLTSTVNPWVSIRAPCRTKCF